EVDDAHARGRAVTIGERLWGRFTDLGDADDRPVGDRPALGMFRPFLFRHDDSAAHLATDECCLELERVSGRDGCFHLLSRCLLSETELLENLRSVVE